MQMKGRDFKSDEYRYGFNGKENDPDFGNKQVIQDYGFRLYNPSIAKFLSVDPLAPEYPWNSPYAFAEGDVIRSVDLDGLEKLKIEDQQINKALVGDYWKAALALKAAQEVAKRVKPAPKPVKPPAKSPIFTIGSILRYAPIAMLLTLQGDTEVSKNWHVRKIESAYDPNWVEIRTNPSEYSDNYLNNVLARIARDGVGINDSQALKEAIKRGKVGRISEILGNNFNGAEVFNDYSIGQGFAGGFDTKSGHFVLIPTAPRGLEKGKITDINGKVIPIQGPRNGVHRNIRRMWEAVRGTGYPTLAFTVILKESESGKKYLEVKWNSTQNRDQGIGQPHKGLPNSDKKWLKDEYRERVKEALRKKYGDIEIRDEDESDPWGP